jgi:hypothetical protein
LIRLAAWAAVALLAALVPIGARAASTGAPELVLSYTAGNTLQLVLGGATVSSDSPQAQIPYGPYQVVVIDNASDTTDPAHMFQLLGPGIQLGTDLQQGDDKSEIYSETLGANSTYTFSDRALPALAPIVFRTTGTPVSPVPAQPVPTGTSGGSNGQSSNSGPVGSSVATGRLRGTLQATVGAGGALRLTSGGKAVTTLKAGKYRLAVVDKSRTAGFVMTRLHAKPISLTTAGFIGSRSATLVLQAGQWSFRPSTSGPKSYFAVAS